ncbi:MAG TPA: tRNA (adenosine(37)-N6)-threonylcarbamoyltransferase complex ATPase subunit type 1 TsaE [Mycobacteriales bacterium]|jgi:tRNA threonylcarbamoyladenosine biosynthesis protein TsaE|nr:tRNA (adenosine(37)-N6)-threonylcarbamoyltransferase complex ATPase subunit type 1 TsaE [Mycobacteriales bacterium]
MKLTAATVEETRAVGEALGVLLRAGDLVILTGDLGAGKTALTQGIAVGLGVFGEVTSPTFVIARVHRPDPVRGRGIGLVHVDAYRLGGSLEVDELDLDTDLAAGSVTVVEWGAGMAEQLAPSRLEIEIVADPVTELRELRCTPVGESWNDRLGQLRQRYEQLPSAAQN